MQQGHFPVTEGLTFRLGLISLNDVFALLLELRIAGYSAFT
jgi:hypothetical protein